MDPLSIAAACVGLVSTITKTSLYVTTFGREVRDATRDMDAVSRELLALKAVLEMLARGLASPGRGTYPPSLAAQIPDILQNCNEVMARLDQTLKRYSGRSLMGGVQWSLVGKQDVDQLRSSLESYKNILSLTVELSTLSVTCEVKADTQEIRIDAAATKMDVSEILSFIRRLEVERQQGIRGDRKSYILQKYLDELTSYAETAYQESVADLEDGSQSPVSAKVDAAAVTWPDITLTSPNYHSKAFPVDGFKPEGSRKVLQSPTDQELPESELESQRRRSGEHRKENLVSWELADSWSLNAMEDPISHMDFPRVKDTKNDQNTQTLRTKSLEHARRESIRARRARREEAREANVPEETDAELIGPGNALDNANAGKDFSKPVYLKGLFSVSITSIKPLPFIRADVMRVLERLRVDFVEIKGGFTCQHVPSLLKHSHSRTPRRHQGPPDRSFITNSEGSDEYVTSRDNAVGERALGETATRIRSDTPEILILRFEIFIVKIPLISLHGIQFKKLSGGMWQYREMAKRILDDLNL